MAEFLEFRDIKKSFGTVQAVDGVSLTIQRGEIFSLLGPSGCGKTTLLRMLAGFEAPDSGRILLNGVDITDLPPHRRQVSTVHGSSEFLVASVARKTSQKAGYECIKCDSDGIDRTRTRRLPQPLHVQGLAFILMSVMPLESH